MRPRKIYLNGEELEDFLTGEKMVSCEEPFDDLNVEYTDLSQIWHDASEEPQGLYDIICKGSFLNLWMTDWQIVRDRFGGWEKYHNTIGVHKWAFIDDLLPEQLVISEQQEGGEQ